MFKFTSSSSIGPSHKSTIKDINVSSNHSLNMENERAFGQPEGSVCHANSFGLKK